MRMTNKIMQNNSLYNINNNKELQDKLSTQMSTKKKISRPSDDPVIAIRALRLRSDVSQITQYYSKNAKDAESWLKVTGDALETTAEILKSMAGLCTQGAVKVFDASNVSIVVEQLKELKDEFYSTGNVDYAGRYMFTGYRTDTSLTFIENLPENPNDPAYRKYSITEQLDASAVDVVNYTQIGNLKGTTKDTYDPAADGVKEQEANIENHDIYRIRLSYDNIKYDPADASTIPKITTISKADRDTSIQNGTRPQETDLISPALGNITVISSTVETDTTTNPPTTWSAQDYITEWANKQTPPAEVAVLIPETGELLISDALYAKSFQKMDADTEIRINYQKDNWKKGDMRPQHYFACDDITDPDPAKAIKYNQAEDANGKYIPCERIKQNMEYDVGYNQRICVNTNAHEVFTLDMDRNVDDLEQMLAELKEIEDIKTDLENMLKGMDEGAAGYDNLKASYAAAEKAHAFIRENAQKMFEGMITKVQKISDFTSLAITDNGTRASRLDLISNRLMTQKSTFETLQSANEDIDVTEVTVQLTSMNYSYQSALLATGKILQNSLMNYI
ncbi:flagellar hook-associated protein 3 [Lachnospiraceae bacterium]|nr:flagellar hook-associated protein 3 [Lachnospiraceae bacterium]